MDESQILQRLRAIGEDIATGTPPHIIFDSIVEAVEALGFDRVRLDLISLDGATLTPAASRGFDRNGPDEPIPVGEDPDLARLLGEMRPRIEPGSNGTGERGIAPLLLRGSLVGKLTVDHAVSGKLVSPADLDAVLLFAQQAAFAQATLWAGSLESLQQTTLAIAHATQEMMGGLEAMSLRERLDMIARRAAKILDAETSGVFLLRDGKLVLGASHGQLEDFDPGKVKPLRVHDEDGGGLTGWIAYHRKLFKDHGPSLKRHPAVAHSETHSPSGDCYSLLAIPLIKGAGPDGELIGLIRADNKKGREKDQALATLGFSQEDEWILTLFAEAAIVAIESAELVNHLKEQGDFLHGLISSSPAGIIAVDRKGLIKEYNRRAEQILGYTRGEVLDKPVAPLYLDENEPRIIGKKLHEEPDHHVRGYDTYVRSKAGKAIPIQHSSTWLFDATGERVGSVGYFVDLREQRELKRREQLLLKASKDLAEAANLDDGLQRLAEIMALELGRSFCGILLMDEAGESLTLRAESVTKEPAWRARRQQIVFSEWPFLEERLKKGRPWAQMWSVQVCQPTLSRLSALFGFKRRIEMLLAVPLKIGDRVVGQLDLGDLKGEERPAFSKEEIALASALAAQVAGLIQRFQLLETTVRSENLLKALVQASPHIQASAEIKVLQQVIVRLAAEMVGCQIGGLFLYRPHLGQLELVAVFGAPEELVGEQISETEGLVGTVARAGETAFSKTSPQEDLFRSLDLKAVAVVPFRRGSGTVEAVLFVGSARSREPFNLADREVLNAFAVQAAIALDTARLMNREQLYSRQMATLHRISDYIQGAATLEEILHSVLTGITANYGLGFNRAVLLLVDETGDYLVGESGIGELEEDKAREAWKAANEVDDFERYLRRREKGEIPPTTVGRRIRNLRLPIRESGVFADTLKTGKYHHVPTDWLDRVVPAHFLKMIRVRTPLAVAPLAAKGQLIGLLVADNKFTQAPIGEDLSNALMTFASTAAVAIENKRLLDQARSVADKLMSFYQRSGELNALSGPREILRKIVAQMIEAAGASWVVIVLIDRAGRTVSAIESSGQASLEENATLLIRPDGISMQVMRSGEAYPIDSVAKMRDKVNPVLIRRSVRAAICLPLSLPGKPIGVMWIHYDEPHRFPGSEVAALQLYVNQAATAYESSRRTETLENIRATSAALAQVDDMRSLLDKIVRGAQRVLKAEEAALWPYDAKTDAFIPDASTYAGDHPGAWSELQKRGPQKRGTAYNIMNHGWVGVEDIRIQVDKDQIGATTRQFLQEVGGRGFQGVVLKVGREKLGVLYAIYLNPTPFGEEERETAFTFAEHVAVALKKARLLDQVQRAREAAEVVARATLLEDPKHALLPIVQETKRALDCSAVVLFQCNEESGTLLLPPTMTGLIPLPEDIPLDQSLVLAMVERDSPYIVQDVASDERYKESPFALRQGIKSCVAVPLKAAGRRVGVMFVNYRNPRRFTADEITNIELFANQAAVAIRNIHLLEESTAKLKQQETLAELSREQLLANSAQATMDRAVEFAARVLDTEFSNIVLPDREGRLLFSAAVGWPQEMTEAPHYLERGEGSQTGYTIRKREPVPVYDYRTVKEFRVPEIVFKHGIHSGLSAPMLLGGKVVGAMLVHTTRPHRFTEDDGNLLSMIANQTATALERARQYETSRRRSRYLEALYDAAKTITAQAGTDQKQILDQIVPNMLRIIGLEGSEPVLGAILLYNEETDELAPASVYPLKRQEEIKRQFGKRNPRALQGRGERIGITGRAVFTRAPQRVGDVRLGPDPDFIGCPPESVSELAVPLIDRSDRGKVIGVLNVESDKEDAFDEEDEEALKALAELVVVALVNARQREELGTQTALAWMGMGDAVVRHELQSHLGILRGLVRLLREDLGRCEIPSQCEHYLEEIENKLPDFRMAVAAGRLDEGISSIPVEELIRACEERVKEGALGRLKVEHHFGVDPSTRIRCNGNWLQRVLDIFVSNSRSARARSIILGSRPGGRRESHVEIYVEDDGSGIPEHLRKWILHSPVPKSAGSGGNGAGLLLAKSIVQTYDGFIYYEDIEPHGTMMIISLPMDATAAEGPSAPVSTGGENQDA